MAINYQIKADLHCHTVASTHAYGTVSENALEASRKGLEIIAMTDHGPELPDSPHQWHFYNLRILPRIINGIIVLRGVEANILDEQGSIDLNEIYLEGLDWVIASLHKSTFEISTPVRHTQALIAAANNNNVDLLCHLDAVEFSFDIKEVVEACRRNNVFIEMNNSSFTVRPLGRQICRDLAIECMDRGVKVIVNSDAHFPGSVGDFSHVLEMLESLSFPKELIFNSNAGNVLEYIKAKRNIDIASQIN